MGAVRVRRMHKIRIKFSANPTRVQCQRSRRSPLSEVVRSKKDEGEELAEASGEGATELYAIIMCVFAAFAAHVETKLF